MDASVEGPTPAMTTTGTYTFSSSAASGLTLVAFGRIGIKRTEITTQHLQDAAIEANLVQVTLGNNQPLLFRSEVVPITLVQGQANYALPTNTIAIQDIYLTTTPSGGTNTTATDRLLYAMSLYEYDAQPNKTTQAPPTTYVVYKTLAPSITFWQTPDGNATYVANIRILSQQQDVALQNGATLDLPYVYLDCFVAGLAHRLSRIYAPDKEMMRKQDYLEAWDAAARTETQDNTSLYIQPAFAGYYR